MLKSCEKHFLRAAGTVFRGSSCQVRGQPVCWAWHRHAGHGATAGVEWLLNGTLSHDSRQSARIVLTVAPNCQAPARLRAARRWLSGLERPEGYIYTCILLANMWTEHCGLVVRCTAPGQADGCSIPWRSNFVSFADPAALVQFQVFPPALREARVRFPRLLRGIGSNNVIIFV